VTGEERRRLAGDIAAEFGVRIDPDDPAFIVVALCDQVLKRRAAQFNGEALAQAVSTAYASLVLPRLQALIATQVRNAVEAIRPRSAWNHPGFIAACSAAVGVVVGYALGRIG